MKRPLLWAAMCSSVLTISITAQTTSGGSPSQAASPERGQVTVTGCLSTDKHASSTTGSGSSGTTGSGAGTTSNRPAANTFVVTNAKIGGMAGSASGAAMTRVKLEGGNQPELRKYVDSQVEIRGTMIGPGAGSKGSTSVSAGSGNSGSTTTGTGTAGSTGAGAAAIGESDGATLRVTSVRQLSSSCAAS